MTLIKESEPGQTSTGKSNCDWAAIAHISNTKWNPIDSSKIVLDMLINRALKRLSGFLVYFLS